jgi:hypothetical protein
MNGKLVRISSLNARYFNTNTKGPDTPDATQQRDFLVFET